MRRADMPVEIVKRGVHARVDFACRPGFGVARQETQSEQCNQYETCQFELSGLHVIPSP